MVKGITGMEEGSVRVFNSRGQYIITLSARLECIAAPLRAFILKPNHCVKLATGSAGHLNTGTI